jgi:enoyl-CoA hydratase
VFVCEGARSAPLRSDLNANEEFRMPTFTTLDVTLTDGVATIALNRPEKLNAMNAELWAELKTAFDWLDETPEARVGILKANGRLFTSGIDLSLLFGVQARVADDCTGRSREKLRRLKIGRAHV